MAIYHLSPQVISSANGKSAVSSAAYRRAATMVREADGKVISYEGKQHVAHAELSLRPRFRPGFRPPSTGAARTVPRPCCGTPSRRRRA